MKKKAKKEHPIEGFVSRILPFIVTCSGILGITSAIHTYIHPNTEFGRWTELFQIILVVFNLFVLAFYCGKLKTVPRLDFNEKPDSKLEYSSVLHLTPDGKSQNPVDVVEGKKDRVNLLVEQLHKNIRRYALFLIVVYVLYIFDNQIWFDRGRFQSGYSYNTVKQYFQIGIDACNGLSALFLYTGFKVLYDRTIEKNNTTEVKYLRLPAFVVGFLLSCYIGFSLFNIKAPSETTYPSVSALVATIRNRSIESSKDIHDFSSNGRGDIKTVIADPHMTDEDSVERTKDVISRYNSSNAQVASNLIKDVRQIITTYENQTFEIWLRIGRLGIGIFNGLAMALLFGRYLSMEHSIYDMKIGIFKSSKHNKIMHYCTIYLLPIYALAQPLFGSFEIDAFGNPLAFSNCVFFVCLIGKIFFLSLTYLYMKHRLLHLYLHSVISSHTIPSELLGCFNSEQLKYVNYSDEESSAKAEASSASATG
jgi:hypothetical protein